MVSLFQATVWTQELTFLSHKQASQDVLVPVRSWQTVHWCCRDTHKSHSSSPTPTPPSPCTGCLFVAGWLSWPPRSAFSSTCRSGRLLCLSVSLWRAASVPKWCCALLPCVSREGGGWNELRLSTVHIQADSLARNRFPLINDGKEHPISSFKKSTASVWKDKYKYPIDIWPHTVLMCIERNLKWILIISLFNVSNGKSYKPNGCLTDNGSSSLSTETRRQDLILAMNGEEEKSFRKVMGPTEYIGLGERELYPVWGSGRL